ncbi:S53 family peptidase [Thiocapsa marina]|nr:S53 family peptidase [Thiocapsa marina]
MMQSFISGLAMTIVIMLSARSAFALPNGARMIAEAPLSDELVVQFVLRTPKERQLEQVALDAGDPDSNHYGRYLSMEAVLDSFGPSPDAAQQVIRYLAQQGVDSRLDPTELYVEARLRVEEAERLAGVTLSRYETADGRQHFLAPTSPAQVPEALAPYVEALIGLDQTPLRVAAESASQAVFGAEISPKRSLTPTLIPMPHDSGPYNSALSNAGSPEGCPEGVSGNGRNPYTPNQWLHAYGLDQAHALSFDGRGERLALIEIDGFSQTDLDGFTDCFGLPRQTPRVIPVPGGPPLPGPGQETILDLQVLAAAAPGLDEIQVFQSTNGQGEAATDGASLGRTLLAAIAQTSAQRPSVVSISLGGCEAEGNLAENILSERALLRAAATGISVFVASGDSGVTACRFEQGQILTNAAGAVSAGYPATSPWVTAVGGTNLWFDLDNSVRMEVVWNDWQKLAELSLFGQTVDMISMGAGTGGLSAWFAQPRWQRATAIAGDAFGPFKHARAVPDVALLADSVPGYAYLNDGAWGAIGGTSAAAPLMAGAVAVMNQALRTIDRRRLGFLSPLLYRFGNDEQVRSQVYRDVTYGDNDTTWQVFPWGSQPPSFSAEAKPGYDLATGWGSPRFPQFFMQIRKQRNNLPSEDIGASR